MGSALSLLASPVTEAKIGQATIINAGRIVDIAVPHKMNDRRHEYSCENKYATQRRRGAKKKGEKILRVLPVYGEIT
jgi:hypothetical protein